MDFLQQNLIDDKAVDIVQELMDELVIDVQKELEAQGHNLSGKLKESLRAEVKRFPNMVQGLLLGRNYGRYVDRGVAASRIPFDPNRRGGGSGTSDYIQGLQDFWKKIKPSMTDKEALSAAFATAKVHAKEGMPSKNSFKFSNNGKRLGFFTDTVSEKQDELIEKVQSRTSSLWRGIIVNMITQEFKNIEKISLNF